jgi:hypothetical protein
VEERLSSREYWRDFIARRKNKCSGRQVRTPDQPHKHTHEEEATFHSAMLRVGAGEMDGLFAHSAHVCLSCLMCACASLCP